MFQWEKINNLGESRTRAMFGMNVAVEEKIDGSLLAVMVDESGTLQARSRRSEIDVSQPHAFAIGINHLITMAEHLEPNATYFFEFRDAVDSHHCQYERVPLNGLVLLDVVGPTNEWDNQGTKSIKATLLQVEPAPHITDLVAPWNIDDIVPLLEQDSFLGGAREGVVLKELKSNDRLVAKLVRDEYRESFIADYPGRDDSRNVTSGSSMAIATEMRFSKVVQKMADSSELSYDRSDIGRVVAAIWDDVLQECEEQLSALSFKQVNDVRGDINRRAAIWYKSHLIQ